MSYTHILVWPQDGLVSIILNRPDKRNALSLELMTELLDAFRTVGAKVRGVILGAQGPVFRRS
jgi:enoyl-CoA hydratase/carnithine racemase